MEPSEELESVHHPRPVVVLSDCRPPPWSACGRGMEGGIDKVGSHLEGLHGEATTMERLQESQRHRGFSRALETPAMTRAGTISDALIVRSDTSAHLKLVISFLVNSPFCLHALSRPKPAGLSARLSLRRPQVDLAQPAYLDGFGSEPSAHRHAARQRAVELRSRSRRSASMARRALLRRRASRTRWRGWGRCPRPDRGSGSRSKVWFGNTAFIALW